MTCYRSYDHLEKLGHVETAGIADGTVHVFHKLDGTNAVLWRDANGDLQCGSRNRQLSIEQDNHGFCAWVRSDDRRMRALAPAIPGGHVVYGEWLIPNVVKTYAPDAWRRFYVFDVWSVATGRYLPWSEWGPIWKGMGIDVIEPIAVLERPTTADLLATLDRCDFLVMPGAGLGEGVVFKNYAWANRFGRQSWAKLVRERSRLRSSFHTAGDPAWSEAKLAEELCTSHLVGKTRAKIVADIANHYGIDLTQPDAAALVESAHRGRLIPQLLGRVYHDVVVEGLWGVVKKRRGLVVDFSRLHKCVEERIKAFAADLFGSTPAALPPEVPAQPVAEEAIGGAPAAHLAPVATGESP